MTSTISSATENEKPTAIILQFKPRIPKTPVSAPVEAAVSLTQTNVTEETNPQVRLSNALAKLNAALEDQKEAVRQYRESMATLSSTVQGLSGSLTNYRDKLGEIKESLESTKATSLNTLDILKDY